MSCEESKARSRYNSTKYKTIKPNPNHTTIKRVQKLYTQVPFQSGAHALPSKSSFQRQSCSYAKKQSVSVSSNLLAEDHQPTPDHTLPCPNRNKDKLGSHFNKNHPPFATREQLYEENLHLKAMLNQLKDTLAKQKIQTEMQKKKNKKYTSILNREFRKDFYYQPTPAYLADHPDQDPKKEDQKGLKMQSCDDSDENLPAEKEKQGAPYSQLLPIPKKQLSNYKYYKILLKGNQGDNPNGHSVSYMIAGIKQKYEQLKAEHERVTKELQRYKAMDALKKLQQISIYCSSLEDANRKLTTSLAAVKLKLASYEQSRVIKQEDLYQLAVLPELNEKIEDLRTKNAKIRQENRRMRQEQRENIKLIEYLESIIIQKDNFQHNSVKTMKKVKDMMEQTQAQLKRERQQHRLIKQLHTQEMQDLAHSFQEQSARQKKLFQQALSEKNTEIKKMCKQMAYLTTIIENWKLGEDANPKGGSNTGEGTARRRKQSTVTGKQSSIIKMPENPENMGSTLTKISERRQPEKQYDLKAHQIASGTNRSLAKDEGHMRMSQQKRQNVSNSKPERKRKCSGVRHSQNSKKMRRVSIEQIIDLPEYLRYRLIGSNISLEQACKLLNYRSLKQEKCDANQSEEDEGGESEQRQKWKQTYINQAELSAILIQEPFKLRAEEAVLLARYIVEDEVFFENADHTNSFVFNDFQNEIERSLAKSIFKAFLQTHSTNFLHEGDRSQFQKCQETWKKIVEANGARINTPLVSIAPSGFIHKDRWNELLNTINAEIGENLREWCIGRMLVESEGLAKLKYRAIVPDGL